MQSVHDEAKDGEVDQEDQQNWSNAGAIERYGRQPASVILMVHIYKKGLCTDLCKLESFPRNGRCIHVVSYKIRSIHSYSGSSHDVRCKNEMK